MLLLVHHLSQLSAGQTVAHGNGIAAHKAGNLLLEQSALHPVTQGIGAVQYHQPLSGGSAVGNAAVKRGDEGIVAAAHVGDVIHQSVEPFQERRGQPLGFFCVEAAHRQTAFRVDFVGKESAGGLVPPNAVLRGKEQLQVTAIL